MNIFGRLVEFEQVSYLYWCWAPPLAVAAACLLSWWLVRSLRHAYANPDHVARHATGGDSIAALVVGVAGWTVAAFLVMLALAGPYENNADVTVPEGSLHVVSVVDTSNSMAAEDYRFVLPTPDGGPPIGPWGSRLQMSKHVFTEQVFKAIPGNKIGLVSFAGEGFHQAPLCQDYSTLNFILDNWMGLLSAPGDGSDYVEGLKVAIETLRQDFEPGKKNVILLFADGGAPEGSESDKAAWKKKLDQTLEELEALRSESGGNLHVVVVGVGSHTEQMIPLYDPRTMERVDWFPEGADPKPKTKLEESDLKQLAEMTGGQYIWLATDGSTSLSVDWAKALGGTKTVKGRNPLFWYPLGAAMLVVSALFLRGLFRRPNYGPQRLPSN